MTLFFLLWKETPVTTSHYSDVIMGAMASEITGVSVVCLIVCTGADPRKHQNSASLAFVRGIHRWPVNSLHKGSVMRKMFPFDDVIMHFFFPAHAIPKCDLPAHLIGQYFSLEFGDNVDTAITQDSIEVSQYKGECVDREDDNSTVGAENRHDSFVLFNDT